MNARRWLLSLQKEGEKRKRSEVPETAHAACPRLLNPAATYHPTSSCPWSCISTQQCQTPCSMLCYTTQFLANNNARPHAACHVTPHSSLPTTMPHTMQHVMLHHTVPCQQQCHTPCSMLCYTTQFLANNNVHTLFPLFPQISTQLNRSRSWTNKSEAEWKPLQIHMSCSTHIRRSGWTSQSKWFTTSFSPYSWGEEKKECKQLFNRRVLRATFKQKAVSK